ncbi:gliding motility protein GldC [Neolewinella lacunae]|uniref:Gliding motility protein GldC n=1 Tax=Neolewinella lacunae TaxID=1517758 RepID=A0A923PSC3_9BACT|nr:gliding motility protein GldC [Neolewinella lacunae]MBC6996588.1 gliding motility protein GldC [Neolewinella lacunae]MDN3634848.1 gliding motility protein GldC [Neolewinella lacunae]
MAKEIVKKRSTITVNVGLNAEQMPVELHWKASDKPGPAEGCKGMLLSLFNEQSKETMKIDLWTKEMQVVEMDRFMYQTLRGLAETYYRATGNQELANDMQQFVFYFGQATGAIPKQ